MTKMKKTTFMLMMLMLWGLICFGACGDKNDNLDNSIALKIKEELEKDGEVITNCEIIPLNYN